MLSFSPLASGPLASTAGVSEPDTLSASAQITVSGIAVTAPDIDAHLSITATAVAVQVTTMSASASMGVTAPVITGCFVLKYASPDAAVVTTACTAILLPDPTNYSSKDVLAGSISSAQRTASVTATNVLSSAIKYANASAAVALVEPASVNALKITEANPVAASVAVTMIGYIAHFIQTAGSASIKTTVADVPSLHVKSLDPNDITLATAATISAHSVRIRVANLSGNNATIATTAPAPPTLLRLRGYFVDAAFNATVAPVTALAFKVMSATATSSVFGSSPLLTVIKSADAAANIAVFAFPVVSTRHRLVSADATGSATASASCLAVQFVLISAASDVSITATAIGARAALMSASTSAILTGTANPRAIFSGAFQAAITANYFAIIFTPKLSPRTDAVVERYSRRVLPTGELRDTLGNEFQNIERTVASVTEATILVSDAEPETKRRGMVRYAVAPWIPVAGHSGLVVYDGNTWSAV